MARLMVMIRRELPRTKRASWAGARTASKARRVLQISLARQLQGLPEFRKNIPSIAFNEGWALYAESLGPELGL